MRRKITIIVEDDEQPVTNKGWPDGQTATDEGWQTAPYYDLCGTGPRYSKVSAWLYSQPPGTPLRPCI